jgi:hypothetical protein
VVLQVVISPSSSSWTGFIANSLDGAPARLALRLCCKCRSGDSSYVRGTPLSRANLAVYAADGLGTRLLDVLAKSIFEADGPPAGCERAARARVSVNRTA